MNLLLVPLVLFAIVGVLTLCGLHQDGKARAALKKAGQTPGPNLSKLLVAAVVTFIKGSFAKKPKAEEPKAA